MRETFVDAGWGALTTLARSVFPFSAIVGGMATAHRHGGDYTDGLWLGTLTGIAAMGPLLVLFVPTLYVAGLLGAGISLSVPGCGVFLATVFLFFLLYTVGLSAVRGLGGTWTRRHTDWSIDPVHWLRVVGIYGPHRPRYGR